MDGIAIDQFFLLVLQCIIVGTLLLFLFKLRFIFGLSLLFIALGVFQYMQTFLAGALYLEIIPGIFISPGSMVMFTGSLFAILLIYIREDALEARKVIYAMLAANIVLAVLHLIFSWSITAQNVINVYNLPIDYFTINSRVLLAGTIVLFLDAFIIIFVYEAIVKYIKPLFWSILITMSMVVVIDSVFFSITAFAGTDQFSNILISGMIAKLIAVVIYSIIFTIYLSFFDKGSVQLGKTEQAFNDIFQTLTYRQKYEKVSLESEMKSIELQQSEIKFKILFETMTQGVIYQNNTGEIIDANPAAQRILGLTLDEMQGKTSMNSEWKAIHEDGSDFPGDSHASMMALKTGKVVNNMIMGVFNPKIKDYTWIKIDAIPQFRNGENKPYQVYTIFNDITIERRTQQKLNELYVKYQNIIHTANIAIAELSVDGTYTFVNPAWEEMFGYSSSEVLGNTTQLIIDPAETEHSLFDKLLKGEITDYQLEKKYKNKNGKLIWCDLYVAANHDIEGNLKSIVSVMINITNKKEFEEKIIEKERITRDALAQVAHNEFLLNQTGQLAKVGGWELDLITMTPFFTKETFDIYELPYGTPPKVEDGINFYAPEARPLIQDAVNNAIVNHSNYDLEVPFITAKGTYKWIRTIGNVLVENNKAVKLFGAIQDITELKASENRFKSIVEGAPDPIFIQINRCFVYLNQHAIELFGAKDEKELIGKEVLQFFHPDFHQAALERIKKLNEDKTLVHEPFEQILIQLNGNQIWVETKGSPITYMGENGGLVFVRDVTRRKEAERTLRESEEKFYKIFKSSPISLIITRLSDFIIIDANDATLHITGYSLEEIKGKKQAEIAIWKSNLERKNFGEILLKDGKVKDYEAEFITKSGGERIWLASAEIIQIRNENYILGIIEDVTEIRKATYDLQLQTEFINTMTENQPAGIVACDADGKLVLFNKTAKEWHGVDILTIPQEYWAEHYGLYQADAETLLTTAEIPLVKAFNGHNVVNLEIVIKANNQNSRNVICNGSSFYDASGNKLGAVIVMNDITHQKIVENNLKRSEFLLNEAGKIGKIGAWEYNLATNNTQWSNSVFDIHAIPIGEVPPFDEIMACYIEGSEEILRKAVNECITEKKVYELDLRFQNALKQKLWIHAIGYPILNDKGEVASIRGVVQDVTATVEAKDFMLKYQQRLEKAQQITRLGYWELDIETGNLFWSQIIYEIFGIAENEFESNYENFMRFVHPEDREMMQLAQDETLAGLKKLNLEHRIVRPNGEIIHVHEMGELIYDKNGKAIKLSGTIMDITKRVEKEIEILQYQKSLQTLTIDLTLVEEKQRKQIAENIHDNLSQSLVISKMKLNDLQKQIATIENKERLKVVINHISEA